MIRRHSRAVPATSPLQVEAMPLAPQEPTLFIPKDRGASILDRAITGFPPDLLNRAAARFQALTWLYAFTFFMSAFFPSLVSEGQRSILFEHPANWIPGAVSIAMAVAAALTIRMAR